MSYLPINEQNQQAPQGQTTPAPAGGPPPQQSGGSVGGGSVGGAKGSATGSPTQFGSSSSKLGDYLTANAPQIGNQANQLAGNLNNQYGQIQGDISNASNQFGQQVQNGYAAGNQDIVNQAISNPTQFTADPNNIKAFQAQYNDQYTGPQNFESTAPYANIQNEVSGAVQQANLLQSPTGLQSYLQGQQRNPTRASSALDSLLIEGNPDAKQTVQTAANQFNGLTDQFGQATSAANQSVQAAQQAAQNAANYAQGVVNPYVQQFNTGIQNAATQAEKQRQDYNNSLAGSQAAANTGRSSLLNAKQAALTPVEAFWARQGGGSPQTQALMAQIRQLFQPNTSQYDQILGAKMDNNLATAANVATPEQYQQAQALSQLLGQGYQSPLDQTLVSQAGTFKGPGAVLTPDQANANANIQKQRLGDLSSLYSSPFGVTNMQADPYAQARGILASYNNPTSGYGNIYPASPEYMAALNRLSANNYGI